MAGLMNVKWLASLAAVVLLCWATMGQAFAASTIDSITYGPLPGTATYAVPLGTTTVQINVTVTLTGTSRWRSTSFTTTPPSSMSVCAFAPDLIAPITKRTVSFNIAAPTASGTYSVNVIAWGNPNCNGASSPTKTNPGSLTTGFVPVTLNHVRILHDGAALTCAPEVVTLKACGNAACSTTFTGSVSVTMGTPGTWSPASTTFTGGSTTVSLSNSTASTYTLAATASGAATTAASCYIGTTASCLMKFDNASCTLDAVEVTKPNNTPIFTKRMGAPFNLDILSLNNGTILTNSTVSVTATLVNSVGTGCTGTALSAAVPFTYVTGNGGRRTVAFTPTSASRNAKVKMVSGSLTACSSDNFSIRPAALTALTNSPNLNADSTGVNATSATKLRAGTDPFTLDLLGATGYDGLPTMNPNMVEAHTVAGVPATAGAISGAWTVPGSAANGWRTSGAGFKYSEVGYFRLLPFALYDNVWTDVDSSKAVADCVADANIGTAANVSDPNIATADGKIGCHFGYNATTGYFGRFHPDHFALSLAELERRTNTATCSLSNTFTYMGEPMMSRFKLEAQNGLNAITLNYQGDFARLTLPGQLNLGLIDVATTPRTLVPACSATAVHPCYSMGSPTGTFASGEADVELPLTIFRASTSKSPLADLRIGIAPNDADAVQLVSTTYDLDTVNPTASTNNHAQVGTTIARYGRLYIENAYGSELLNQKMKVNAQYYTGTQWATNTLDNCTPQAYLPFVSPADYKNLDTGNMPFSNLTPGANLVAGAGVFLLAKPTGTLTKQGSVNIKSAYPSYLPGNGRATFGVYKSGPVIYVRETY